MSDRLEHSGVANFSAGPAALPLDVLRRLNRSCENFRGGGTSVTEISHRSLRFEDMLGETDALVRTLLNIPDTHRVLFLTGGATTQFRQWLLNLSPYVPARVGYIDSGHWSLEARASGQRLEKDGPYETCILTSGLDNHYRAAPDFLTIGPLIDYMDYVHVVSNETVSGIKVPFEALEMPDDKILVGDMSSDLFARRFDVAKFGLIYASAQKNFGESGMTLVIVREDLIRPAHSFVSPAHSYQEQLEKGSLRNTPPSRPLCSIFHMLEWINKEGGEEGGVATMERRARERAELLYDAIDAPDSGFESLIAKGDRSMMNVVFRLTDPALQPTFLKHCEQRGIEGLKGHGAFNSYYGQHLRASNYNGQRMESIQMLIRAMMYFRSVLLKRRA